jgi:spermidine/putrescine transport system permease protein
MTAPVAASTPTVAKPRRRWGPLILSGPSMLWYAAFFVLPIMWIVLYSFGTKNTNLLPVPVDMNHLGLQNYRAAFDETFFRVFRSTIKISVLATALCVVIGLPVSYFITFKVKERWRGILLALVIVPSFTSYLIRTLAWRIPLAANGSVSKMLQDWGVINGPISLLDSKGAVQLAIVYNYIGFMILPLYVALDRIEGPLREASKDLGAGRIRTFLQVTFPLASPGIVAGILLTFIPMCGDFVTATILGGTKGNMIGALVESQFVSAQNWPSGSAMAVMMVGAVLVCLVVGFVLTKIVTTVLRYRRRVSIVGLV